MVVQISTAVYCKRYYNTEKGQKNRREYRTTPRARAGSLWWVAKKRATKKNLDFTISKKWIFEILQKGLCEVTNISFDLSRKGMRNFYSPSIDRIDNTKGYTQDNCRVVIWGYNSAKGVDTDIDVMIMARALCKRNPINGAN